MTTATQTRAEYGTITFMSLTSWLALGALIVAIIAIPVSVWAARRWGNRRRRILFTYEAIPLLPRVPSTARDVLTVSYRDMTVTDPHLVTIRVQNIGPSDVTSAHFDGGRAAVIDLNCKLYGLVSATHPSQTSSSAIGSNGIIELKPLLLKCKEEWIVEVIVSGVPKVNQNFPLIDTDVLDEPSYDAELAQSVLLWLVRAVANVTPGASIAAAAIDSVQAGKRRP